MRAIIICICLFGSGWNASNAYSQTDEKPSVVTEASAMRNTAREVRDEGELRRWLQNMVWYHRYTPKDISVATGIEIARIQENLKRLNVSADNAPSRKKDAPLLMLPYPGGKHPRIGFLDGALQPQRETKVSVFAPWDPSSYVVIDVPEAIWSDLGLTYLAHTHIDTIWSAKGVELAQQEWEQLPDRTLRSERKLPNGIVFGTRLKAHIDHIQMEMWLTNGTTKTLSDLRVQNCVMLKFAKGFEQQTNDNKVTRGSYVACKDQSGKRWLITAWEPNHRTWSNPPCPCLHSDPRFPDCEPGQTKRLRGWFSFFEGADIEEELKRIQSTGWTRRSYLQAEN